MIGLLWHGLLSSFCVGCAVGIPQPQQWRGFFFGLAVLNGFVALAYLFLAQEKP